MIFSKISFSKKRQLRCLLPLLLSGLLLSGCGEKYPTATLDGSEWNKEWTVLGTCFGVETELANDFTLLENPVVLTGQDTHYATWTWGEATDYTNADGDETDLYAAQIYMLCYGTESDEEAAASIEEWIAREAESYEVDGFSNVTTSGMDYELMTYTVDSDTNPYSQGITAFATFSGYAVTIEISATDEFDGDVSEALLAFLDQCHYGLFE